jgi:uncharacterized membrane protein YidH (DUF202 family)
MNRATTAEPAARAREDARRGASWYQALARFGLVAKGVSFGIVGVLAIKLALGEGGKATSREGAVATLAQHSFGKVLLVLLAIGFAGYAIWRFIQALAEYDHDEALKAIAKAAGYVGRGLIYAGLTFSTVKILLDAGSGQSQNEKAHKATATILEWPGGTWIVGLAGAAIIGVGLWNAYRGVGKKFEEKWRRRKMTERARKWAGRVGVSGHLARAVVFTLIGIFVIKAAVDYEPKKAIGLDGALQKLSDASYGPYLLGATAAGLVCYALYCLVDARYRDVTTGDAGPSRSGHSPDGALDTGQIAPVRR